MTLVASVQVDGRFTVGAVRPGVFGSFIEHLGRSVYGGVYEPDHPSADDHGFRRDVLELVRELGVTNVRYPGGSYAHTQRWEDGIGPRDRRPRRADLAWHSIETHQFGFDDFVTWCRLAGVEPMMTLNLGPRGLQEALDLYEYANVPGGTELSDLRIANGHAEPHDIRTWCLGNEPDHRYTAGFLSADAYAERAAQVARAYRMFDADVRLSVAGSSGYSSPSFGAWDRTVLDATFDEVDMISVHAYHWIEGDDLASFLAAPVTTERMIAGIIATADAVAAQRRSEKRIDLCVDEWNVWYLPRFQDDLPRGNDWPIAPRLLEDRYTIADAVVVGQMMNAILRHADRVRYANQAQLVNVIAPIVAEPHGPAWRQTTFHPFALASRYGRGTTLQALVDAPDVGSAKHGDVSALDVTVIADGAAVTAFLVNRSVDEDLRVRLVGGGVEVVEAVTLAGPDPMAIATAERPIEPARNPSARADGDAVEMVLPPASWSMLRLRRPAP